MGPGIERIGATFDQTLGVLKQWAAALRSDWSVDGRSSRLALLDLAAALEQAHENEKGHVSVATLRGLVGVCPLGKGHWTEHCDDYGCRVPE